MRIHPCLSVFFCALALGCRSTGGGGGGGSGGGQAGQGGQGGGGGGTGGVGGGAGGAGGGACPRESAGGCPTVGCTPATQEPKEVANATSLMDVEVSAAQQGSMLVVAAQEADLDMSATRRVTGKRINVHRLVGTTWEKLPPLPLGDVGTFSLSVDCGAPRSGEVWTTDEVVGIDPAGRIWITYINKPLATDTVLRAYVAVFDPGLGTWSPRVCLAPDADLPSLAVSGLFSPGAKTRAAIAWRRSPGAEVVEIEYDPTPRTFTEVAGSREVIPEGDSPNVAYDEATLYRVYRKDDAAKKARYHIRRGSGMERAIDLSSERPGGPKHPDVGGLNAVEEVEYGIGSASALVPAYTRPTIAITGGFVYVALSGISDATDTNRVWLTRSKTTDLGSWEEVGRNFGGPPFQISQIYSALSATKGGGIDLIYWSAKRDDYFADTTLTLHYERLNAFGVPLFPATPIPAAKIDVSKAPQKAGDSFVRFIGEYNSIVFLASGERSVFWAGGDAGAAAADWRIRSATIPEAPGCPVPIIAGGDLVDCSCACADPTSFTNPFGVTVQGCAPPTAVEVSAAQVVFPRPCESVCAQAAVCAGGSTCVMGPCQAAVVAEASAATITPVDGSQQLAPGACDVATAAPSAVSSVGNYLLDADFTRSSLSVTFAGQTATVPASGQVVANADPRPGGAFQVVRARGAASSFSVAGLGISTPSTFSLERAAGSFTSPTSFTIPEAGGDFLLTFLLTEATAASPFTVEVSNLEPIIGALDLTHRQFTIRAHGTDLFGNEILLQLAGVIANQPPVASAGPDQIVECTSPSEATASLHGTATDPDGATDVTRFQWFDETVAPPVGLSNQATPSVSLSLGVHPLSFRVYDHALASGVDAVQVAVRDTKPPAITKLSVNPSVLWPPNHRMVSVFVSASATDVCSAHPSCSLVSISSNEPVNGLGDGDTAPDWTITGPLSAQLRAERSGRGLGRIYTLNVRCADSVGNGVIGSVLVSVPQSQGKRR